MKNPVCKKVEALLALYVENKLNIEDKLFIENHIKTCKDCYQKFIDMKNIINNLRFEYEKLLDEFEKIETNKIFNIREYENFYKNISPYIDDELCYDDSIKFRKYLLKSKPARAELANAYGLKNNIRNSVATFKNTINVNFSKKIIKKLKEDNFESFDNAYKKIAIFLSFIISSLILVFVYLGFNYINDSFANNSPQLVKTIKIPNESEMIEFSFD